MLSRKIIILLSVLILIIGIALLIYPITSNHAVNIQHKQLIKSYDVNIQSNADILEDALSFAEQYNEIVRENGGYGFVLSQQEVALYNSTLNYESDGMMGYISIPGLSLLLPIYHGISQEVLQIGIGHIESTSLPTGGDSTHSALAGHSGMSNAKMFTKLDELQIGDEFIITIANKELKYEIYNIATVLPSETELLKIKEGEDLCTLITCTPFGLNTYRLLVQGKRVDY